MISISHTGIRNGEFITSSAKAKQCAGTVMQVRSKSLVSYQPSLPWVKRMDQLTLRDVFNNYAFFSTMNPKERLQWLIENSTTNDDLYMEDVDMEVRFVAIGGKFMVESLTKEQIDILLAPDTWMKISDVFNMFPRKPGSKAKKHTLIFRPSNWTLVSATPTTREFSGLHATLETGELAYGSITGNVQLIKCKNVVFAIKYETADAMPTFEHLVQLCFKLGFTSTLTDCKKHINWFSPALHKSLIQKIIRYRPNIIAHNNETFKTMDVLVLSFCMLLVHPGAFVPTIQRFVSGIESALKRLAVAISEDSYVDDGRYITTLLIGAWLAQNAKYKWYPTDDILLVWLKILTVATNPGAFKYNWHTASKQIKEWNNWTFNYWLLGEIRSFHSDIDMLSSIADNNGSLEETHPKNIECMELTHCVDQHSFTDVAHYLTYDRWSDVDFSEIFKKIWQLVTGINTRFTDPPNDENPAVIDIKRAQKLCWLSRSGSIVKQVRPLLDSVTHITYALHTSWLAALVGPHEMRVGRSTAIVMVRPDDIYSYVAVKRPARQQTAELTEEEQTSAIAMFTKKLEDGIVVSNVPNTLMFLKHSRIILQEGIYHIEIRTPTKVVIPWDDFTTMKFMFNEHTFIDHTLENALAQTGNGVEVDAFELLTNLLETLPVKVRQRLLLYTSNRSSIDLYKISRDGSGIDYSVTVEDIAVNEIFAKLCCIFPVALDKNDVGYTVKHGPLMWYINDVIRKLPAPIANCQWSLPAEEQRALWEHQKDAITKLDCNSRSHIIWIPPGLGKTAIICNHIAHMIRAGKMPTYCVYTLPPSALATVEREFGMMSIPHVHLDMRNKVDGKPPSLQSCVVNIIYHDHLRMANQDEIKKCAPDSLFIVDEFHKTLNKTIRTSISLELAKLSNRFIAMTGTLIKDTNVEDLIQWLEQVVDFEVTKDNYWVAISSVISRKVETKVVVDRIVLEADLNEIEKSRYYDCVPDKLGGHANNINFREAVRVSYLAITRRIVELALAERSCFIVARNAEHQQEIALLLKANCKDSIEFISIRNSVSYTPTSIDTPRFVITTTNYAEGYNMTKYTTMITGVYFTNQATRDQLERRINRLDQTADRVKILVVHAGIISYIHKKYENVRSLAQAMKGFAKDVNMDGNVSFDELA